MQIYKMHLEYDKVSFCISGDYSLHYRIPVPGIDYNVGWEQRHHRFSVPDLKRYLQYKYKYSVREAYQYFKERGWRCLK